MDEQNQEQQPQDGSTALETDDINVCKDLYNCGNITKLAKGRAIVRFVPDENMVMDKNERNQLIHSGYVFNAASYAAIVTINKRYSIMIASDVKFLAPIELGHEVFFYTQSTQDDSKKCEVKVEGYLLDIKIFDAVFHIAVFDKAPFSIALEKMN